MQQSIETPTSSPALGPGWGIDIVWSQKWAKPPPCRVKISIRTRQIASFSPGVLGPWQKFLPSKPFQKMIILSEFYFRILLYNSSLELCEAQNYFSSLSNNHNFQCFLFQIFFSSLQLQVSSLHVKFPTFAPTACRGSGSIVVNNPTPLGNNFVQQSIHSHTIPDLGSRVGFDRLSLKKKAYYAFISAHIF